MLLGVTVGTLVEASEVLDARVLTALDEFGGHGSWEGEFTEI
jgi:hypothetical protein